jgi:predicted nucleic acid-binding protein
MMNSVDLPDPPRHLVDSSGWLEYFADDQNADFFADPIRATGRLVVSVINVYEVFKHVLRERGEDEALRAVAYVKQGIVVGLDSSLAIRAARISHERKIPMADSMILSTARACDAELWTQDSDFEGIDGVRYIPKSENES